MVSCNASHVNVPGVACAPGADCTEQTVSDAELVHTHVAGVTENAACTELVFIGLLNCSTIGAEVEMHLAACAGLWLMITGLSGRTSDWAI